MMLMITMTMMPREVLKKWTFLMTFAIKHRTPLPLPLFPPLMTLFPFSEHTKKGLEQYFWTKNHLFLWLIACENPLLAKVMKMFHFF